MFKSLKEASNSTLDSGTKVIVKSGKVAIKACDVADLSLDMAIIALRRERGEMMMDATSERKTTCKDKGITEKELQALEELWFPTK